MIALPFACSNSTGVVSFPDDGIDSAIDQQDKQGKQVLNIRCQTGRVDQRFKIVLDEARFIHAAARRVAKPVFKRGQRANPAGQFNQDAPGHTGEMQPGKPGPAQHQQAAGDNEQDERGMQDENQVSQQMNIVVPLGVREGKKPDVPA